jgi:L,D-transpeptidase YcbB
LKALHLLILICLSGIFVSCTNPDKKQIKELEEEMQFEVEKLHHATKKLFTDSTDFVSFTSGLRFKDTLLTFYANRQFKPIWAINMTADSMAEIVISPLANCKYEGFQLDYYRVDSIRSLQQRIADLRGEEFYNSMAKLELLVSDNILSYHQDRVSGRTSPRKVFDNAYQLPERKYENFSLFSILKYNSFEKIFERNTHQEEEYQRLSSLLRTYYNRVDSGELWFTVDTTGIRKLEPGDSISIMPQIAKKLYLMGVISEEEMGTADSFVYNKSFSSLVSRFQESYGLLDDAIFGRNTFGLLNISLQDRIDQISANMERIRWFEFPEEKPYIAVNLPSYELSLIWEDSVKSMRVCIGKTRPHDYDEKYARYETEGKYWLRPPDHETPQISSEVVYMVINPTWTVPRSIITREMFHQMKRDSTYLEQNGYGVFYKGVELRSDSINWGKYAPNKIPFDIVQQAGEANALGKIKFIFPNPFHIYLHDTPQKSKFKWTERAVSHGCVRVENPLLLGEFLMQNHEKNNVDDYRIWMGYSPMDKKRLEDYDPLDSTADIQSVDTTEIIRFKESVPVFFMYNTVWFDEEGNVQYRNDVYDKNRYIIEAMKF